MFGFAAEDPVVWGDRAEVRMDGLAIESTYHFKPERLFLTEGADWDLCSLVVDDRELLDQELPGSLFVANSSARAPWIDTLRADSSIYVSAMYRGSAGEGHFRVGLGGVAVPPSHDPRAFSGPIRLRSSSGEPIPVTCDGPERVLPGQVAWFVARADRAVRIDGLVLDLACEEWTIEDVSLGGKSQLVVGSLTGDVFSPDPLGPRVTLVNVPLDAGTELGIKATYRGPNPRGRFFGMTCTCAAETR